MEYDYTECKTCARKGATFCTFCIGCQPMMLSGGTPERGVAADMRKRFDKLEAKQDRTLALLNAFADVLIKRFGE